MSWFGITTRRLSAAPSWSAYTNRFISIGSKPCRPPPAWWRLTVTQCCRRVPCAPRKGQLAPVSSGVDLILSGEACPVFCPIRPPGHHAVADKALGFCLFNNVAVAHALDAHGLKRVAIIDFDADHGNGTEEIFKYDKRVLFCSSFQHPFYPFTGHATPNLVAISLAAGADGPEFREAVTDHWLPALGRFAPQMVFVSAGFDAHILDGMSDLCLT